MSRDSLLMSLGASGKPCLRQQIWSRGVKSKESKLFRDTRQYLTQLFRQPEWMLRVLTTLIQVRIKLPMDSVA